MTNEYFASLNFNKRDNALYKGDCIKTTYETQPHRNLIKKSAEEIEVGAQHRHDVGTKASSTELDSLRARELSTEEFLCHYLAFNHGALIFYVD